MVVASVCMVSWLVCVCCHSCIVHLEGVQHVHLSVCLCMYVCVCVCVRYSNRMEYAEAVRKARMEELACKPLMSAVQCGLASVIPLQLLSVLTPQDLSLRVCGKPTIDLGYLKVPGND